MRSEARRKERRMRRNNIIIGLILLFLMVFSMLAVTIGNSDANPNLVYGEHTFKIEDMEGGGQIATTKVNGQKYGFYTLPVDTLSAMQNLTGVREFSEAPSLIFVQEPIVLGGQATSEQLYLDMIIIDLQQFSGKMILSGITTANDFSSKTVFNCSDASQASPVIILQNGTYPSMNIEETNENCYILKTDSMSLLAFRDYIIYRSLGIIQ